VDGTPNHGLAVAAADLGSTASNWAAARRLTADDPATRPYLEVIFSEPTPSPPPTATPKPRRRATSQPAAPTATPVPTPTPTPEPILLPVTGGGPPSVGSWVLLVGGGLGLLAGLIGVASRDPLAAGNEAAERMREKCG
jgi:hypothetical protein